MRLSRTRLCILCAVLAALTAWLVLSVPMARAQGDKPVSFINDVAPILKENCFACHDARKRSGKFDMTTFEKLLAGGANGEQIAPGKPKASELHALIVSTEERRMPQRDKGEAIAAGNAKVIEQWIAEGAKLDGGLEAKADLVRELRLRWKPPAPPAKYKFPAVINALAFTPDGKSIVAGGHHELTVWSVAEGKLLK